MRVLKKGSRVSDSQLSFAVHANEQGESRLGLAIAKRAVPHAADRNAIKRQIREAFRLHDNLPAMDIVALTRRSTSAQDVKLTRKSAENLFQKIADGKIKPNRNTIRKNSNV